MKIAITGSTGLIGKALVPLLAGAGHSVTRLVRPGSRVAGALWDPQKSEIDLDALEGTEAFVHLAGESIAGFWTKSKRQRVLDSRQRGTRLIATSAGKLRRRPAVLVSASAIGYYGDRPADQPVDEGSHRGSGFLADVVEKWEMATEPARDAGIRVVNTRLGLVLSGDGGMLGPMLPVFKAGLGGRIGGGRQMWSWVAIDDVVQSILFILTADQLVGPVNIVAPLPVTNLAFTRTMGRVLHRPTIFGVPACILKAVGGQMAREMLLSGVRVAPRKLQQASYEFLYPELEMALKHVLGRR